ncbi:hypothetical protein MPSEU_000854700 [Mayamaea pseudoterrestris]|nr:hypothetical protein MPSEU_000854700 [Mayamaea pseudoterrestris]
MPSTSPSSKRNAANDDIDESTTSFDLEDVGLADIGFMFDSHQSTKTRRLVWNMSSTRPIHVTLNAIDDHPGALQSGHYLWPAAALLIDFVTGQQLPKNMAPHQNDEQPPYHATLAPISVLELGAGCALASIAALQIWQASLQCVLVTDHDPGVVERARDNYETTVQSILEQSTTDSDLNDSINDIGSIPVCFQQLEWGSKADDYQTIIDNLAEHTVPPSRHVDLILATDVIYDASVVAPLFRTAMTLAERMLMAQSFAYDEQTEAEIARMCVELHVERNILYESEDKSHRIQEFVADKRES